MFSTQTELHDLKAENERLRKELSDRFTATIVCLCGSTKFKQTWIHENARLTGEGQIVLAVGLWGHHERQYPDAETKIRLDETHKRKIDLCDWVWVLDVDGYIGESTRSEIEYATKLGKPVRYLSQEFPDYAEPNDPLAAANAKITELEQSATTLRQLEELLRDGWTVVYRIMRDAPVFFVYHQNHLVNPDEFCESTLPAAIAAAWERKEE